MTKPIKYTKNKIAARTGGWWLIEQHRFVTDKHPCVVSDKKRSNKLATLTTHNERQMLMGLANMTQTDQDTALRIALYEACHTDKGELQEYLQFSSPLSEHRGFQSRDKKVVVQLPKEEKQAVVALAKELGITDKELIRLALIWLVKTVRDGSTKRLTNSRKLTQKTISDEWTRNHPNRRGTTLGPLRAARDEAWTKAVDKAEQEREERYRQRGEVMARLNYEANGGLPDYVVGIDENGDQVIDLDYIDRIIAEEEADARETFASAWEDRKTGLYHYFLDVKGEDKETAELLSEAFTITDEEREEQDTDDEMGWDEFEDWQAEFRLEMYGSTEAPKYEGPSQVFRPHVPQERLDNFQRFLHDEEYAAKKQEELVYKYMKEKGLLDE